MQPCSPGGTGIILASYGARTARGQAALTAFAERTRAAFPGFPLCWAFTGHRMADAGASLAAALTELTAAGVRSIALQPLHLIPGTEFEDLLRDIASGHTNAGLRRTALGLPLLGGDGAIPALARRMRSLRPPDTPQDEATLWVGHGSLHAGQRYYHDLGQDLGQDLNRVPDTHIFLGTLRPEPAFAETLARLRAGRYTRVGIRPFFSLPGRHAEHDILGDHPDSWRGRLESQGFQVTTVNKGLLEEEGIATLWLERLTDAVRNAAIKRSVTGTTETSPK